MTFSHTDAELIHLIRSDCSQVPMRIRFHEAWIMFSCLKLAIRHPRLGERLKYECKRMLRDLEKAVAEYNPRLLQIISSPLPPHLLRPEQRTLIETALQDSTVLTPSMTMARLWIWIGCAQIVWRHPETPPSILTESRMIASQFETYIVKAYPSAETVITKGWNQKYDH
jgi:hypothetical protein